MTDNNIGFNEYEFRTKRASKENKKQSEQKIMLTYNVNKNEQEPLIYNNENLNKNYTEDHNGPGITMQLEDNLDLNFNQKELSNNGSKNKYPDFHSFLQLTPKDNIEIPTIKYPNYIFNIGNPSI